MEKSKLMYEALVYKYKYEIASAKASLVVYLEDSVGIGEHPQHVEEMDKLVTQITDAEDKLSTIEEIYQEWNGMTRV
jgi:hypothetical protein